MKLQRLLPESNLETKQPFLQPMKYRFHHLTSHSLLRGANGMIMLTRRNHAGPIVVHIANNATQSSGKVVWLEEIN